MKIKHGYIQNTESIPAENTGAGWIYFSDDDKAIYLDTGEGPVKFSGSDVDLSNYYTANEVDDKIPSLDGYATEAFVSEQIGNLEIPEGSGNSTTNKEITIAGVNVGNLKDGDVIPEGTSLTELLERMLRKAIGVKAVNPSVTLTGVSLGNTYEVGTVIDLTLGYNYTDGKFEGESGYTYSVNAGCENESVTYFKNNNALSSSNDRLTVIEGNTSYKVTIDYNNSTVVPVNNIGENVDIVIPSGSASDTKNVKGAYKYFMGYSTKTSYDQFNSDDVRDLTVKTGYINGSTSVVGSTAIKSDGTSIVIACPNKYTLKSIQNGVGADILSNFESGEVTVTTGESETIYTVYVYPITNGAKVEFKNVTIG